MTVRGRVGGHAGLQRLATSTPYDAGNRKRGAKFTPQRHVLQRGGNAMPRHAAHRLLASLVAWVVT